MGDRIAVVVHEHRDRGVGEHRPGDGDRDRPDAGKLAALSIDHVAGVERAGADVDAHVDRPARAVGDELDERVVHERRTRDAVPRRPGGAEEPVGLRIEGGEHLGRAGG